MTDRQKESHLARLFVRVANVRGFKARWCNYYIAWVHQMVTGGYYNRMRSTLEGALTESSVA
jgi:hypothetical protein